ncbi:MAG: hypothetical protein EZS28_033994, partial [Streblomastix strix]
MRSFHEAGLIHRDIKCSNILFHIPPGTGRVHAKISDFQLSQIRRFTKWENKLCRFSQKSEIFASTRPVPGGMWLVNDFKVFRVFR